MTLVVLSLGSNIDREKNLQFALDEISQVFGKTEVSPVYETESVGFDGPPFFNFVAGVNCDDAVKEVQSSLREIERRAGRIRGEKTFDSRILDIDIILFGQKDLRSSGMDVPRLEIEKYAFVLKPLSDLYPDMKHPVSGRSFASMWEAFDKQSQQLRVSGYQFRA